MRPIVRRTARLLGLSDDEVRRVWIVYRRLAPNKGPRDKGRVPLWHEDVPFVLMTSQKAGSTVAVRWFFGHAGLGRAARDHHPFVHNYEQEVFICRPGYEPGLKRAVAEQPVLKVVREPGARAWSSYLRLWTLPALGDERSVVYHARRRVLRDLSLGPDDALPFRAFARWLAEADHRRLEGHLARQVTPSEDRLPNGRPEPLKIEEMGRWMPAVEARFGLPPTPKDDLADLSHSTHHVRKGEGKVGLEEAVERGLPGPLERLGPLPAADTRTLAALGLGDELATAFGEDYARYGYEAP